MISLPFRRNHARWRELASAYLDDELSPGEVARFERHLSGCPRCQQALADAREMKALLAVAPPLHAPRTFQLTAEMVASPARSPRTTGHPVALRLAQAATAIAVVAFATILTVDLTAGSSPGGVNTLSAPERASAPMTPFAAGGSSSALTPGPTATPTPSAVPSLPSPATAVPTSPPSIVPPTRNDVGAQGFSPSPSPSPTTTPSPTETTPPGTPSQSFGAESTGPAHDSAATPRAKSAESETGPAFGQRPQQASTTAGWYRPTEIALGAVAIAAALVTAFLTFRRRRA